MSWWAKPNHGMDRYVKHLSPPCKGLFYVFVHINCYPYLFDWLTYVVKNSILFIRSLSLFVDFQENALNIKYFSENAFVAFLIAFVLVSLVVAFAKFIVYIANFDFAVIQSPWLWFVGPIVGVGVVVYALCSPGTRESWSMNPHRSTIA